jgi:hypothetical protein
VDEGEDEGEGAPAGPADGEGAAEPAGGGETPRDRASAGERAGGPDVRIGPNKHRDVQAVRDGRRRLFKGKAVKQFLNWFAATGNVTWSAQKIGFSDKTIWKHRMNDPRFAEAFDRAFEQSVARNKARMVERKAKERPIAMDGGAGESELEDCDLDRAWALIVEIERAKGRGGGAPAGRPRRSGRAPQAASNAQVRAELEKRLRAFARRVRASGREPPPWLPPERPKRKGDVPPRSGEEQS